MASKEISRTFDPAAGAIVVTIEDALGVRSVHTVYALGPDGREADVAGQIAARMKEADDRAVKLKAAFLKHGWQK